VLRNYSLSGPPGAGYYRITVKREHDGAASGYLHTRLAVGDQLDVAAPRGTFILDRTRRARAADQRRHRRHARSSPCSTRWRRSIPIGRSGGCTARAAADHSFAAEARRSSPRSRTSRTHVYYSRPGPDDREGRDFDSAGRLTASLLAELEPPRDAEAYLCGPAPFMDEISAGLAAMGIDASRIHTEPFGPAPGLTPGIAATPARTPHPPAGEPGNGPTIEFARSNLAVPWSDDYAACSSSPRPATCPSAGRAAPASATPARRRSSPATSTTAPTRSSRPPTAARSSAARSRATTWCSTCDVAAPARGGPAQSAAGRAGFHRIATAGAASGWSWASGPTHGIGCAGGLPEAAGDGGC
jgi:ferredoxin-NADP reductase